MLTIVSESRVKGGTHPFYQVVLRLLPTWQEVGALFRTHFVTFLPENLSPHEKKACVNRSMPAKRTVRNVTTAYGSWPLLVI
jgi:hypothetical protein